MKKTVLFVCALFVGVFCASAQGEFKKGDKFVEGSVSFSKTKGVESTYGFQPTVGYFVTDKVAAGLSVNIGRNDEGVKTTGVGAFGRYYVLNIGKNFKTFSQLGVGTLTVDDGATKTTAFRTAVDLGANYFVTNRLALSINLADVINFTIVESASQFNIGWSGVTNPLSVAKFGVLYKF
jgi:outer membrane protein